MNWIGWNLQHTNAYKVEWAHEEVRLDSHSWTPPLIGQNPSFSKSKWLYVEIFWFLCINWEYFPKIPLHIPPWISINNLEQGIYKIHTVLTLIRGSMRFVCTPRSYFFLNFVWMLWMKGVTSVGLCSILFFKVTNALSTFVNLAMSSTTSLICTLPTFSMGSLLVAYFLHHAQSPLQ